MLRVVHVRSQGIVMWRAFVYGNADFGTEELVKQSYR